MMYYIMGIYSKEIERDFENLNPFIALFFVAYGNGVGDFKAPTFNLDNPSNGIIFQTYLLWFCNMVFSNIILLNFVVALVSQVYENVMNSQVIHIYDQRQKLNDECDLFF